MAENPRFGLFWAHFVQFWARTKSEKSNGGEVPPAETSTKFETFKNTSFFPNFVLKGAYLCTPPTPTPCGIFTIPFNEKGLGGGQVWSHKNGTTFLRNE